MARQYNVSTLIILTLITITLTAQIDYINPKKRLSAQIAVESDLKDLSYKELEYIYNSRLETKNRLKVPFTPCARAILGCCKEKKMIEGCSEELGCGSLFFDSNPCQDRFMIEALEAARLFYEQYNTVST